MTIADLLSPVPLPLAPVTPEQRLALAVHEAGHAVVALTLGVGVEYATLQPKAGRWGHDACMMAAVPMDTLGWEDRVVIWLAVRSPSSTTFRRCTISRWRAAT